MSRHPDRPDIKRYGQSIWVNLALLAIFIITTLLVLREVDVHTRAAALKNARAKAHIILKRNLATHEYFSSSLKPSVFKIAGDRISDNYFDPRWMSSTYALRHIHNIFRQDVDFINYYYKEASINARTPENEADPIEREFINRLNMDSSLDMEAGVRIINDEAFYVIMHRGETMQDTCLMCHSTPEQAPSDLVRAYGAERAFGRKPGKVISALSIKIPLADTLESARTLSFHLKGVFILALVLLLSTLAYIAHRFKRTNNALMHEITERTEMENILREKSHQLGERIKELNCLHQSSSLLNNADLGEEELLKKIIDLIPPAMQYPEHTGAIVRIEDIVHRTANYSDTTQSFKAPIYISGIQVGELVVCYSREFPRADSGPFLNEELQLMNDLAQLIGSAFERRIAQRRLNQSLFDKDRLMKDVHRRIKNNLSIIQSLLSLRLSETGDEEAKSFFIDSQNRVKSMSMIHDRLLRAEDISKLNAPEYIRSLVNALFHSYDKDPEKINITYELNEIELDVDTMIPLGLIVNELVSNAFKYAFPNDTEGLITIALSAQDTKTHTLSVMDNGIGLPDNFSLNNSQSLGIEIVSSLTSQINGHVEIIQQEGTTFRITFPGRPPMA